MQYLLFFYGISALTVICVCAVLAKIVLIKKISVYLVYRGGKLTGEERHFCDFFESYRVIDGFFG